MPGLIRLIDHLANLDNMIIAQLFVIGFYVYLLLGFAFALWFIARGANQLDENMQGSRWTVRLLLLPGATLLWPVLLRNLLRKPHERPGSPESGNLSQH